MSKGRALRTFVETLGQDPSLREPQSLRQRSEALDDLEACLTVEPQSGTTFHQLAKNIYAEFEAINFKLYESVRFEIQQGAGREVLLEWMPDWNDPATFKKRISYDYLDELASGIVQLEEPSP